MNTSQMTSHFRTNFVIAIGVAIILISLAWLGYRFTMQIKASQTFEQTMQDDSTDQVEPTSNATENSDQTGGNTQDATASDN